MVYGGTCLQYMPSEKQGLIAAGAMEDMDDIDAVISDPVEYQIVAVNLPPRFFGTASGRDARSVSVACTFSAKG